MLVIIKKKIKILADIKKTREEGECKEEGIKEIFDNNLIKANFN